MVSKSALRKQISNFELFPPFNYDVKNHFISVPGIWTDTYKKFSAFGTFRCLKINLLSIEALSTVTFKSV